MIRRTGAINYNRIAVGPQLLTIEYRPTHAVHLIAAHGTAAVDGSLYGFYTICGLYMQDDEEWSEDPDRQATCATCIVRGVQRQLAGP